MFLSVYLLSMSGQNEQQIDKAENQLKSSRQPGAELASCSVRVPTPIL